MYIYILFSLGDNLFILLISWKEHKSKTGEEESDYIKIDVVYSMHQSIQSRVKRQPMKWEKMCVNM
jgi:hypothetical protein